MRASEADERTLLAGVLNAAARSSTARALPVPSPTAKAQQTVDNAHIRYFIVRLHRLLDRTKASARLAEGGIKQKIHAASRPSAIA